MKSALHTRILAARKEYGDFKRIAVLETRIVIS